MKEAIEHFLKRFEEIESGRNLRNRRRRIGSELKFPLVTPDGKAAGIEKAEALWAFLTRRGWNPLLDSYSGETIGAARQGEMNEDRAACETGFCKVEFSLAHTDTLHKLNERIAEIKTLMSEFSVEHDVCFLGFGMQPLTAPGKHLLMKKSRNLFWDRLFGGNRHISPEEGTDVHLFTVSASNQVHIDVTMEEAVDAVNVFNGLAGAQIALTANSNIWKGSVDPEYKCLGEMFWDWWLKDHRGRYGVPERKFNSLTDYFSAVLDFPPVYVRRDGVPVGLPHCPTFSHFYTCKDNNVGCKFGHRANNLCGLTPDGNATAVQKEVQDLDQHFTFFWHNARLSRYYTLENRINDQQPPEDIMTVPALTLGIMENLNEAVSLINDYPWEILQEARLEAARSGLQAVVRGDIPVVEISRSLVEIAESGLKKRGMEEEGYLTHLSRRIQEGRCPADDAADIFHESGPEGLVERMRISQ